MGLVCLLFGRIFQCFVSFPQAAVHGAPWEDHQKALRKAFRSDGPDMEENDGAGQQAQS